MTNRINFIINRSDTKKTSLKNFPNVENYICSTFSNINVTDVPIYIVTDKGLSSAGFQHIGGCYVHHMYLVIVKNEITIGGTYTSKTKFEKVLQSAMKAKIDVEDVLVHEMIHAVSGAANRSNRRYTFDEEEFVYTNTIDFYKNKGMTDEEIINKNFLPFCIQDVLSNNKEWVKIFDTLSSKGVKVIDLDVPQNTMNRFLGRYAEMVVPLIVDAGRKRGQHMIDLYNEYGKGIQIATQSIEPDVSMRFRSIDMSDVW